MKQDYVTQRSQISEDQHLVTEGIDENSSSSAGVDVMNIILVAAECAPWSKTGKNSLTELQFPKENISEVADSN